MLTDWKKSITESTTYVKNICEKLNDEQCRCLFNMKRFKVSYKMYKDIVRKF